MVTWGMYGGSLDNTCNTGVLVMMYMYLFRLQHVHVHVVIVVSFNNFDLK